MPPEGPEALIWIPDFGRSIHFGQVILNEFLNSRRRFFRVAAWAAIGRASVGSNMIA